MVVLLIFLTKYKNYIPYPKCLKQEDYWTGNGSLAFAVTKDNSGPYCFFCHCDDKGKENWFGMTIGRAGVEMVRE